MMGEFYKYVVIFTCVLFGIIIDVSVDGLLRSRQRREGGETDAPTMNTTTMATTNITTMATTNTTSVVDTSNSENTGLIVGVVVAVVIAIVIIVLLVFFILRMKKQRSSDMERDAKVQMNTTKNAGVYVDTINTEQDDVKETDKLRSTEEEA